VRNADAVFPDLTILKVFMTRITWKQMFTVALFLLGYSDGSNYEYVITVGLCSAPCPDLAWRNWGENLL